MRKSLGAQHEAHLDSRVLAIALMAFLASSCSAHTQPWPTDCPPAAPVRARPLRGDSVESLAGRHEVTLVTLSYGSRPSYQRGHLELAATDTLQRYFIQTIRGYVRSGMRPLAGQFSFADDSLRRAEEAEVEDGVLFVGCRRCADGSPDELRLLAASPSEVWACGTIPKRALR
jgi:hypothetical protein